MLRYATSGIPAEVPTRLSFEGNLGLLAVMELQQVNHRLDLCEALVRAAITTWMNCYFSPPIESTLVFLEFLFQPGNTSFDSGNNMCQQGK